MHGSERNTEVLKDDGSTIQKAESIRGKLTDRELKIHSYVRQEEGDGKAQAVAKLFYEKGNIDQRGGR